MQVAAVICRLHCIPVDSSLADAVERHLAVILTKTISRSLVIICRGTIADAKVCTIGSKAHSFNSLS